MGADINVMASNMWQSASLPFVAGLGPRKAQALLQAVQAQEFALNRVSLWKEIWKPGNVVFRCSHCGCLGQNMIATRSAECLGEPERLSNYLIISVPK